MSDELKSGPERMVAYDIKKIDDTMFVSGVELCITLMAGIDDELEKVVWPAVTLDFEGVRVNHTEHDPDGTQQISMLFTDPLQLSQLFARVLEALLNEPRASKVIEVLTREITAQAEAQEVSPIVALGRKAKEEGIG